ncbi:MAG TPA: Gmad2 immunoglobulin-like domain-containing protein, partial [Candidatus Paceibacterota bacterium]|nr:Gmad2 immunoglobulin-like domain-containing protein [Candidatus Paceibacterota bacterium]
MKTKLLVTVAVVVAAAIGAWLFFRSPHSAIAPSESLSPSPTASASETPNGNITISLPKAGETVESPILVTGTARVFENQFTVQVKDSSGKVVASAHVMSDAKDAGQFGNYSIRIPIPAGTATDNMTVEALSYSPKGDNSYEGYAFAPVKLKQTDTMNVY